MPLWCIATATVFWRKKVPVAAGTPATTIEQIVQVIQEAGAVSPAPDNGPKPVGIIVPGIYFAGSGSVWAPNLWGPDEVPLRAELEDRLKPESLHRQRSRRICSRGTMARHCRGLNDVVFLAVGTGIGAGIIAGGQLLRGHSDIAGAVGWFALNPSRSEIYTKVGCWEAESAGPGLAGGWTYPRRKRSFRPRAAGMWRPFRHRWSRAYLGMGIANIISLLNPEMVVLGGGLMQAADLFLGSIKRVMTRCAQPVAARQVRIEVSQLGEDAGLLGAARLAFDHG